MCINYILFGDLGWTLLPGMVRGWRCFRHVQPGPTQDTLSWPGKASAPSWRSWRRLIHSWRNTWSLTKRAWPEFISVSNSWSPWWPVAPINHSVWVGLKTLWNLLWINRFLSSIWSKESLQKTLRCSLFLRKTFQGLKKQKKTHILGFFGNPAESGWRSEDRWAAFCRSDSSDSERPGWSERRQVSLRSHGSWTLVPF